MSGAERWVIKRDDGMYWCRPGHYDADRSKAFVFNKKPAPPCIDADERALRLVPKGPPRFWMIRSSRSGNYLSLAKGWVESEDEAQLFHNRPLVVGVSR